MLQHQFLTSKTYRMSSDSSILFPTYLGALVETPMNALCNAIKYERGSYWPKIREEVLKISRITLLSSPVELEKQLFLLYTLIL